MGEYWGHRERERRIVIVGPSGAVGRELLSILLKASHPPHRIELFGRREGLFSALTGSEFEVKCADELKGLGPGDRRGQLAFLCTPALISARLAPHLLRSGAQVLDLSSAHRQLVGVPLVVAEVNGDELISGTSMVAIPNCTATIASVPLAVLDRRSRLEEVVLVSYQAVSGAGQAGLDALESELDRMPAGRHAQSPFPCRIARNLIPAIGEVGPDGSSEEEAKICRELARILGRADLKVEATAVRVPVARCHSIAIHALFERELDPEEARTALGSASGVTVHADPTLPRPLECAGTDPVHVGRIRRGTRGPRSLCCFAVGDQLRKGAALNALQVAARLLASSPGESAKARLYPAS